MTERERRACELAAQATRVRATARRDLAAYLEHVITTDEGRPIRLAPLHRSWLRHVSWCWAHGHHALVLAPFGHGKSVLLAKGLGSYILGRHLGAHVNLVCNDDGSAQKRVAAIGKVVTRSTNFREVFPECMPDREGNWTLHELWLRGSEGAYSHNPSLRARGVFTTGIGGRVEYSLFDDVVDQRNALDHPELRERLAENFHSTWMSRLNPGGHAMAIGTAWHREDVYHQLMRNPRWVTLRQAVRDDLSVIEQEVYNAPPGYPGLLDRERLERDAALWGA